MSCLPSLIHPLEQVFRLLHMFRGLIWEMACELCPKTPSPCPPELVMVYVLCICFLPKKTQGLGLYSWNSLSCIPSCKISYSSAITSPHLPSEATPWKSQESSISGPEVQPMSLPNGYIHLADTVALDYTPSSFSSSYVGSFMAEEKCQC